MPVRYCGERLLSPVGPTDLLEGSRPPCTLAIGALPVEGSKTPHRLGAYAASGATAGKMCLDFSADAGSEMREAIPPSHWLDFGRAISHPMRMSIIRAVGDGSLSPSRFAETDNVGLSHASYHFEVLAKLGFVAVIARVKRRGATEHTYSLTQKGKRADMRLREPF